MTSRNIPSRDEIIHMVSKKMYSDQVLDNRYRGDMVEMMVLEALQSEWKFVGLRWHPWDLQRGEGKNRVRIQVKQCATLQLWNVYSGAGKTRVRKAITSSDAKKFRSKMKISFGWKNKVPYYFEEYNPGEYIESEGWFCEIFVIGVHDGTDPDKVDQVDPQQWQFLVIPATDLERGRKSMVLTKALQKWAPVGWHDLRKTVEAIAPLK